MNFIIANGVVVVPVYGTADRSRRRSPALQAVFPDRKRRRRVVARAARQRHGRRRLVPLHHPAGAPLDGATARSPSPRIQTSYGDDLGTNIAKTEAFVREAAKRGAQVVLPSELFQGIYFLHAPGPKWFATALAGDEHPCVLALQKLAAELGVVIPVSFFEKDGPRYYNSIAMVDADGEILGVYRKSHIPDGPGYQEKYYFRPGDTGFKAWNDAARHDRRRHLLGPVVSRSARARWRCGRRGAVLSDRDRLRAGRHGARHARAVAARDAGPRGLERRAGRRRQPHRPRRQRRRRSRNSTATRSSPTTAARSSRSFGATDEGVLVHTFDLDLIESYRADWGFFRDRRADLYAKSIV